MNPAPPGRWPELDAMPADQQTWVLAAADYLARHVGAYRGSPSDAITDILALLDQVDHTIIDLTENQPAQQTPGGLRGRGGSAKR